MNSRLLQALRSDPGGGMAAFWAGALVWTPNSMPLLLRTPTKSTPIVGNSLMGDYQPKTEPGPLSQGPILFIMGLYRGFIGVIYDPAEKAARLYIRTFDHSSSGATAGCQDVLQVV